MVASTPHDLGYAGLSLDRAGERRHDGGYLADAAADPSRRIVLFSGDRALFSTAVDGSLDLLFAPARAATLDAGELLFLGRGAAGAVFAARLPPDFEAPADLIAEDLRAVASDGRLAGEALALGGYAKSMLAWHARNGFCANCGAASVVAAGGWRRECPSCGAMHFPRVDPVVIMLVVSGDRCLLGRQYRFADGMWSCLAGFVEPGETIEDAARREIFEEAGVRIGRVNYALSQPWPFPSQLMLGVTCEADGEDLTVDHGELEDARWFSREDAALMLSRTHPDGHFAPPPAAIAHHLLRLFARTPDV